MDPARPNPAGGFRHPDALSNNSGHAEDPARLSATAGQEIDKPPRRPMPKPPRRHRGIFGKLISFILIAGLVLVIGYAVFLLSIISKISTNSWQLGPLSADSTGRTNVLILGVGDPGHDGENLTDTIMLLSLDARTKRMAQVSVPRDLRVSVPGYGSSKVNAANAYGGVMLAEQTVSNTLGVPIDYYLKTDFSGLKGIVDAVGGLDVDVKEALIDREYPCDDNQYKVCGLNIKPGLQHMDGAQALAYARCRKGTCGNDFGRAQRQQEIISLLKPKILDPVLLLHPERLKLLVEAGQKGIKTDLGLIQLLQMANTWRVDSNNAPISLVLSTAPGGLLRSDPAGTSDLLPIGGDFDAISERVRTIFQ